MLKPKPSLGYSLSIVTFIIAYTLTAADPIMPAQVDINETISSVLSRDCKRRSGAVTAFIKNADPSLVGPIREEITHRNSKAAAYLQEAFGFVEASGRASMASEDMVKRGLANITEEIPDTKENRVKIAEGLVKFILGKLESEELLTQAYLIGYLVEQAHHYSNESEAVPFKLALKRLLSGPSQRLQNLAAVSAGLRKGVIDSKEMSLIPILLKGLKSREFALRYFSQLALSELTKQDICFNPLDDPATRNRGEALWQKWHQQEGRKR